MKIISWTRVLALILALCEPAYADNFGVRGHVAAGIATGATLSSGDLGASQSTTTGAVFLGGSSSSCRVDYGIGTASTITIPCPVTVQSSTSTGALTLGGSVHSCAIDYGVSLSQELTIPCVTQFGSNVFTSGVLESAIGIASGSSNAGTPTTGQIISAVTTTTGKLILGGTGSTCSLDYNITIGSSDTINCGLNISGSLRAGYTTAPAITSGDLGASRSTTTGALVLGGSGSSCTIDYGVSTAGKLSTSCPFLSPTSASVNFNNPVYASGGGLVQQPVTGNAHWEIGTFNASPFPTTTYFFTTAYGSPPVCMLTVANGQNTHIAATGTISTTALQIADAVDDYVNFMCYGI